MSEVDPVAALVGMAQQASAGMRQMEATMLEASRPPRFEYVIVAWERVNERAKEGWQLFPIDPVFKIGSDGWGWVMRRQLGAADEAAEMLKEQP